MTTYTGAAFNNGAVLRILEMAIRSQDLESTTFETEITRFCRTVKNSSTASWVSPLASVSALLDLTSEEIEKKAPRQISAGFAENLTKASAGAPRVEFLRLTAELIRDLDRRILPDFNELPMSPWEAEVKFSSIKDFSWWVESDEYEDFEESLIAGVESEHPYGCRQKLPILAAEAQEALLTFPDPETLKANLRPAVPWASADILRQILRIANAHMTEQH
ncbi:hypothetical protein ACG5V6_18965 [Streptomyces chitinivorans]|uniref:Uncharacterized protein n=1 Tax=Streptomyces chitinivorans TaxID=1257027 RepID=A0ABW7HWK3_9ACTN|nr:hypothetical protein [Streptomyces chitinivorans]MDH2407444.1 hypothetical protein [Streptomyces chitinivorans]